MNCKDLVRIKPGSDQNNERPLTATPGALLVWAEFPQAKRRRINSDGEQPSGSRGDNAHWRKSSENISPPRVSIFRRLLLQKSRGSAKNNKQIAVMQVI